MQGINRKWLHKLRKESLLMAMNVLMSLPIRKNFTKDGEDWIPTFYQLKRPFLKILILHLLRKDHKQFCFAMMKVHL